MRPILEQQCNSNASLSVYGLPNICVSSVPFPSIAQVSRWLPTAAASVRSQVRSCGICGGQSGTWGGFRRILRFPFPTNALHSSTIQGWHNRPISDRSTRYTQPHINPQPPPRTKKKQNNLSRKLPLRTLKWFVGCRLNEKCVGIVFSVTDGCIP
jgi:hypothetical protein